MLSKDFLLLFWAALLLSAIEHMGILTGFLFFACAFFCGIIFCAFFSVVKADIAAEDSDLEKDIFEEWT